jgi:hypothetical protein
MGPVQKMMIENKGFISLVWGGMEEKKGGPKMKVYPVMLMKIKGKFSTGCFKAVKLHKNKPLSVSKP